MAELLSKAEYAAIAAELRFPTQAFIDGSFRNAVSGRTFASSNPATGERLADIAACDAEDVNLAVASARLAFEDGRWSKRSPGERKAVMQRFAQLLEDHAHELAVMESLDSGKPVRECQNIDVPETLHTLRWHAELIDKIYDSTAPVGSGAVTMVVREPIGVVGLVLPWNFPLLMLAWKIGPSLAAGCSIVVKPARETTLTALRVAELAHQAGIPAGVFNVVPGGGREAGEPIGRHPDVAMVSFTGSTETGRLFLKYAAESNLKRVVLECGGKNPAVVMNDVEDLDQVAQHVVNGAFWNMGENCSASSRLIVHADIKDALLERIGVHMRDWKMGDPLDPENRLGALVSKAHFEKVRSYIEQARNERLDFVYGGQTQGDIFVEPTVVDDVEPQSRLFREEIFGPVLSVTPFTDIDGAIDLANDTVYGLAASAYTGSLRNALRLAREIRAGIVTVNCFGEGDASTPFGGYKESGFGGRDKSIWAHDQYTELKTIWIDAS
ncbi:gamma-glutamyl-gamma-aminobutyraldehyde dehydrogenase [Pseudomonas citronellolis]|uniref:aldehyde dehydrogenase n=1 Tax=Pseudomonas citronellolis TaxID=53408 RepID=UPI0020A10D69|nr:aldehyde dehydrogenase [Pseudomonas citronellolis]MCP1646074.1 gamma-glutamyl-gamma-aminobutyraldehyde dehydrogenase [Pseudomonas citronellolis]MCP1669056.1 gamma-glutamyl-gamma-aminobutyraldehyde dehydrogenase [Pseudomonas citronellolis]MCP1700542.1 gamma-glutamyl-gamma-aminobutyraldehyde dehydrogenase [Pseudomonas citronellolis]MCP1706866.1 gamma-glutamyl-gamma-aminobutyraldehyde dehydrogenase [Pseudomonas citronellolis]MCP1800649.1 gamma-glutamyl-gamma-aminobutyraldehyde dehydrogenase [P